MKTTPAKSQDELLTHNKEWAAKMSLENPDFFSSLLSVQKPQFLWIGCSDSRVPPDLITGTRPGEIFIHRNVANLVIHTDLNLMSVVQYAVDILQVDHVIVCGHYGCGGIKAAMTRKSYGLINKWLRHIKDVYRIHQKDIEAEPDSDARLNRLTEWNVKEQVMNLAKTSIIQASWQQRTAPHLYGWVYDLADGIIKPLCEIKPGDPLDHPIYEFDGPIQNP